jgi:hypothetical protein
VIWSTKAVAMVSNSGNKKGAQPRLWNDPRMNGLSIVVGIAILLGIAYAITSFIPSGSGSEKCWNSGGRSDDTFNC